MKKSEEANIIKWAETKSDEELKEEYYDAVDKCLGSVSEKMYELGYDNSDIAEREKYEKYLREKADLLEFLCFKRGIELWEK